MAIKRFVPKKVEIIDRRTSEGGYYVAECEVCSREYYPKRSNSKYCSHTCLIRAYRERLKNGEVNHREDSIDDIINVSNLVFRGSKKDTAYFLNSKYNVLLGKMRQAMTDLGENEYEEYDDFVIVKTSPKIIMVYDKKQRNS